MLGYGDRAKLCVPIPSKKPVMVSAAEPSPRRSAGSDRSSGPAHFEGDLYSLRSSVAALVSDSTPARRRCSAQDDNIKTGSLSTQRLTCDTALVSHLIVWVVCGHEIPSPNPLPPSYSLYRSGVVPRTVWAPQSPETIAHPLTRISHDKIGIGRACLL